MGAPGDSSDVLVLEDNGGKPGPSAPLMGDSGMMSSARDKPFLAAARVFGGGRRPHRGAVLLLLL